MIWKQILKALSIYLFIFSLLLIIPLTIAFTYEFLIPDKYHPQPYETYAFFKTFLIGLILSLICYLSSKKSPKGLFRREGIALVVIIWIITPALGALPLVFTKTLNHFEDAYFEMCSGFTTTGITVLLPKKFNPRSQDEIPYEFNLGCIGERDVNYKYFGTVSPVIDTETGKEKFVGIEAVGKALLFWRSFSQWLGGIGVVLLFIAILPALETSAKVLFQSEALGPIKEGLTPRIQDTATWLFKIYIALSLFLFIGLILVDPSLTFFDAITLTFSTISSGGFTVTNGNISSYDNPLVQWLVILFMILGTINFSLFYYLIKRKFYRLKNIELGIYIIVLILFSLTTAVILKEEMPFKDAFRKGVFQMVSTITTTGFTIGNYDFWPYSAQVLILVSMFIGGMSGSTAGSIKIIRHYLLNRIALQRIKSVFSPSSVLVLNVGNTKIEDTTKNSVLTFFFIYIAIAVIATIVFVFDGIDPETALGISASVLNNTGCAFRVAGPEGSFAFLSPFSKYFASFLMLLGRLELFIILMIFIPAFWKKQ